VRTRATLLLAAALTALVAGCGSDNPDKVVGPAPGASASSPASAGKPDDLVVLADDKGLQTVDNVVPVVRTEAVTDPLERALGAVSAALTTSDLRTLNRKADVERQSPQKVAQGYASDKGLGKGASGGSGKIVVGAANFSESQILANLYKIALDGAGFSAEVKNVTNREVYEPALERGELTVFPEYVGTFTEFLNKKKNGPNATALASGNLDSTVQALRPLASSVGLSVLEPSQAADQNAFAVTRKFAQDNGLKTLSDLSKVSGGLILGGPPECPKRPFCQPGLEQVYGLRFTDFVPLDAGGPLTKAAIKQGRVQIGLVFSSDGSLSSLMA
jgi:osmoprotectant transport system substrate-binding protein